MINKINLKRGLLAVFSFTLMFAFFGCTEDLAIDVEIEETKTITVDITEEMYQAYLDSLDGKGYYETYGFLSGDQEDIAEYKERVESMEIEKVTVKMVNETTSPAVQDGFALFFRENDNSNIETVLFIPNELRVGVELRLDKEDFTSLEKSFVDGDDIRYRILSKLSGPAKFDLEVTVKGKLKVKAKAD